MNEYIHLFPMRGSLSENPLLSTKKKFFKTKGKKSNLIQFFHQHSINTGENEKPNVYCQFSDNISISKKKKKKWTTNTLV
jgi:hypothetical protein